MNHLTDDQASKILTIASILSELGSDGTTIYFTRGEHSWEVEILNDGSISASKFTGGRFSGREYHATRDEFAATYAIAN